MHIVCLPVVEIGADQRVSALDVLSKIGKRPLLEELELF